GAVSSFVITDPASGDELDVEVTGNAPLKVETMYFVNRQRVDMQAGLFSPGDVTNSYHRYGMEFTRDKVVWTIDGMAVRTLPNTGQRPFPNKLSQVKLGLWDGSATAGDWAGHADWSRGPM
ncbi:concanavalin A-like lectin/glucanase, partial [Ramicandelaber brevisporus]